MFESLWAIADEGPKWAAVAVTVGLSVSLIPICLACFHHWRGMPRRGSALRTTASPCSAW
jgi:hypothetical protein